MKKLSVICILVVTILLNISCDPAVHYKPKDWQPKDTSFFINNFEDFDLELTGIGGLIGQKNIGLEGKIYNRSKSPNKFKIEKAVLSANGKEYIGEQNFTYGTEVKTIEPNQPQKFRIEFRLEKYLDEVLQDPIEINLIVITGNQKKEITIPMVNEQNSNLKQ